MAEFLLHCSFRLIQNHDIHKLLSLHYEQPPKVVMPPVKAIRWDNYILHMKSVFPHWFMKEVYVCHAYH